MKSKPASQIRKRKSGELSADDLNLWHRVKRTVEPLPGRTEDFSELLEQLAGEQANHANITMAQHETPAKPSRAPARNYPVAPYSPPVSSTGADGLSTANIDDKAAKKLLRGRISIEDRIDLHGMTQEQAHRILVGFLARSHASAMRMVLVITGKGRLSDGILRQSVPQWLREPQLSVYVSAFRSAHVTHGGEGALYVRLRRADKHSARKGKAR